MDDHLSKPINPEQLFQAILRYLHPQGAQDAGTDSADSEIQQEAIAAPPINLGRVTEISRGDRHFEGELFRTFLREADRSIDALIEANRHSDREAQKRILLNLASQCGDVGAEGLLQIVRRLDARLKTGGDATASEIGELRGRLEQVRAFVAER